MPLCCLDAVLVMKMDNEVAFKRSAGRRVDPMSGSEYHIEYAPPPMSIMVRSCSFLFAFNWEVTPYFTGTH
ncbi:hypothetical protein BC828DRAFT_350269 [Blastocladiella britannica]|nr:hypothetical protein BC828DRAFT_350269 [Blastocladiella britannica]